MTSLLEAIQFTDRIRKRSEIDILFEKKNTFIFFPFAQHCKEAIRNIFITTSLFFRYHYIEYPHQYTTHLAVGMEKVIPDETTQRENPHIMI